METKKINPIHYTVVFLFAFLFRFIPGFAGITPYGMAILGTFIAAIYGWSTIGMVWTSFMCLTGIALTIGTNQMVSAGFNSTIIAMIFIFPFISILEDTGATKWVINKIIGSKFTKGKPWMTVLLIFFGGYIGGILSNIVMTILLLDMFRTLFKAINIEPYSKLPTFMVIGLLISILMGQLGIPIMGMGLMLLATYNSMFPDPLNFATYMLYFIPMGLAIIVFFVILMRFVFKVDVSPLKNYDPELLGESKPVTKDQKIIMSFFVLFMIAILLSSIQLGTISTFLSKFGLLGITFVILCILMLLKREDGTPFLDFRKAAMSISWDPVLMVAFILVISSYMNTAETGISQAMMLIIKPFMNMNPIIFIIVVLFVAVFLTNLMNNLIIVVLFMPVLMQYAIAIGANATQYVFLLWIFAHFAICTPAASTPAGIVFAAQDLVHTSDMMKYGTITVILLFIFTAIIGLSYANILF